MSGWLPGRLSDVAGAGGSGMRDGTILEASRDAYQGALKEYKVNDNLEV